MFKFLVRLSLMALTACLTATLLVTPAVAAPLSFSTFVSSSDLSTLLSNNATIGFDYAGNKFVGSVYFGANNNQLYATDLNGMNLTKFGNPIPGYSSEIFVSSSLGLGGFPSRDVYAGNGAGPTITHFTNNGLSQNLFTTLPNCNCNVRGIVFDEVGTFGGKMLVSTSTGQIFSVTSAGVATQIANIGQDSEGMAIGTSAFGTYGGYLLVGSEGSGQIHAIAPGTFAVTLLPFTVPSAEMLSSVPLNLGHGGPLEGFYAANYAVDIIHAGASQFNGEQGDLVVTGETSHLVTDIHWNGSTFVLTTIGQFPNQPEDGIFVTEAIVNPTPEPGTLVMLGSGIVGLAGFVRRKINL